MREIVSPSCTTWARVWSGDWRLSSAICSERVLYSLSIRPRVARSGTPSELNMVKRWRTSDCVVVNRDLAILHANKTARKYFQLADRRGGEMEFADLPQVLGAKI